jgi:hypothetical protein
MIAKVDYQSVGGAFDVRPLHADRSMTSSRLAGVGNVLTTRPEDAAQRHRAHSLTAGDTRVFGSNVVNAARVAWNRTRAHYHLERFGADTAPASRTSTTTYRA